MNTLCIYHGNCADGFGAAWAYRKHNPTAEFHAGVYQDDPPDCTGRDVVIVDFSYKRPVMEKIIEQAKSVTVLDHHKTAQDDLEPLLESGAIKGMFDMEHSGAMLTWMWFHGDNPPPPLLHYIEDRDLWRFRYPETRAIQAAVFSYPYNFAVWDDLMKAECLDTLEVEGRAIERKHHKDIAELVGVCKRRMTIGGYDVQVASLPYTLTSDAGLLMAKGEPFAACYWDTPDWRVFSLRSDDDGIDVSEVAAKYGGGGHHNAAGFRVPLPETKALKYRGRLAKLCVAVRALLRMVEFELGENRSKAQPWAGMIKSLRDALDSTD